MRFLLENPDGRPFSTDHHDHLYIAELLRPMDQENLEYINGMLEQESDLREVNALTGTAPEAS